MSLSFGSKSQASPIPSPSVSVWFEFATKGQLSSAFATPSLSGTAIYPVQAGSAALSANGQFLFQTNAGGSAILTVRAGGTTFYFVSAGTI